MADVIFSRTTAREKPRMPRFFFDIHEGNIFHKDEEGTELGSFEDVRREAQRILPEIIYNAIPRENDNKVYVVLVTDESGAPLFSATLHYAGLVLKRADPTSAPQTASLP